VSLEVRVAGQLRQVELRREGDRYRGHVGERPVDAEVLEHGSGRLQIRLGEKVFDVTVAGDGARLLLDLGSHQVAVEILDPLRTRVTEGVVGEPRGRREVRAAMPGKVVAVRVNVGDEVARGQALLVLEAMKMENEVPAPRAGRVVSVGVAPGHTVETGALLAAIE